MSLFFIKTALATDISACQALSADTYYNITSNITATVNSTCFTTSGNNVTLECNGYTIFGNTTKSSRYGLYDSKSNINVYNCKFENWNVTDSFAVFKTGANGVYENITIQNDSKTFTIYTGADNNTFNNFDMIGTSYFYIYGTANNNTINNLTGGLKIDSTVYNTTINDWTLTGATYLSNIRAVTTGITIVNRLYRYNTNVRLYLYANNLILNNSIIRDNTAMIEFWHSKHDIQIINLTFRNNSCTGYCIYGDAIANLTIKNSQFHNSSLIYFTKSAGTQNNTNSIFENNIVNDTNLQFDYVENGSFFNNIFIANLSDDGYILVINNGYNDITVYDNNVSLSSATRFLILNDVRGANGIFEVYNNSITNTIYGIRVNNCSDGLVYNNTISTANHGLLINQDSNNIIAYDNYIENSAYGLLFEWGSYNNVAYNNTVINSSSVAMYELHNTYNNTAYDNSFDGVTCIKLLDNSTESRYYNNILTNCSTLAIMVSNLSLDNSFEDMNLTSQDIDIDINSTNNIFLNISGVGTESVESGSSLTRKWYFDSSSSINNTNITIINSTGNAIYSSLINGSIPQQTLLSYINEGGTQTDYSNYTITASATGYATNTTYINLTSNANVIFSLNENVAPIITIISPLNQTYTTTTINFNVSTNENTSWCGFSLDGTANITMTGNASGTGFNYTNSTMSQGSHNIIFACNDTVGNMNASSGAIVFSVDSVVPVVTITSPTNTTYTTNSIDFNFTLNEAGYCEYSLNSGVTNYTMTANASNTGFNATNTSIADGSYTVNVYCNDTTGNINNSVSVTFLKDTTPAPYCGDATCNNGETCSSCSADCGSCGGGGGTYVRSSWDTTYINDYSELKNSPPLLQSLEERQRVMILINSEKHYVGVIDISGNKVTINVSSDNPKQAILSPGETAKFEINNDSYYDIKILLNNIYNIIGTERANLTITYIHEKIPEDLIINNQTAVSTNLTINQTKSDKCGIGQGQNLGACIKNIIGNPFLLFVTFLVIFIIWAAYAEFHKKKKY